MGQCKQWKQCTAAERQDSLDRPTAHLIPRRRHARLGARGRRSARPHNIPQRRKARRNRRPSLTRRHSRVRQSPPAIRRRGARRQATIARAGLHGCLGPRVLVARGGRGRGRRRRRAEGGLAAVGVEDGVGGGGSRPRVGGGLVFDGDHAHGGRLAEEDVHSAADE